MKLLITTLIISMFTNTLTAQVSQQEPEYTIPEIGLFFTSPNGYKLIDSSSHSFSPNSEIKVWIKRLMFQKDSAGLVFTIKSTTQKGISPEDIYKKETKHFYDQTRIRTPDTKFDSSSTTVVIDSKSFTKFIMSGKKDGVTTYAHVQLSTFIKGYMVGIAYTCTNLKSVDEIEKSLMTIRLKE